MLVSLGILLFAAIMASMIIEYFPYHHGILFLNTKPDGLLNQSWYIAAFYTHIVTSIASITLGSFQFMPYIIQQYPSLHRRMGYIYVLSVLCLAAPSGFIISLGANGGLPAKTGFVCLSIVWWIATFRALRYAMTKQWQLHINWMIRSFAITLAALTLRTEGFLFHYLLHTKPIETYVTLSWISWIGNLFIAEILMYFSVGKRLLKEVFVSKQMRSISQTS